MLYFDPISLRVVCSDDALNPKSEIFGNGARTTTAVHVTAPMTAVFTFAVNSYTSPAFPGVNFPEWAGNRIVDVDNPVFLEVAPPNNPENFGHFLVSGIRRKGVPAALMVITNAKGQIVESTNLGITWEIAATPIALRPNRPATGTVRYDPERNELFNDATGHRSQMQGTAIFQGGRRYKDSVTNRIYYTAKDRRG